MLAVAVRAALAKTLTPPSTFHHQKLWRSGFGSDNVCSIICVCAAQRPAAHVTVQHRPAIPLHTAPPFTHMPTTASLHPYYSNVYVSRTTKTTILPVVNHTKGICSVGLPAFRKRSKRIKASQGHKAIERSKPYVVILLTLGV